ncbi:Transcription factor, fungi [Metarhizium guizhouense ARSEF 977]|uniref:Transcription factor, fungi n=1 Tax=Metarhizium guizhouense (strain ARSEF 977) TaxID=1276136 RepID=A0A0B4G6T1_METGA|nr:Transcription factor, fungi [Metarhizium guizhouense ARSEF 977]
MTVPVSCNTLADIEARLQHLERQSTATWQSPRNAAEDDGRENDSTFADNPTTQFLSDMTQVANLQSTASPDHASIRRTSGAWLVETDTSSMVVPKRATADELIDCYERFVYPLFPILHLPSFRASYMCLWEPERPGPWETLAMEATFYATLNIVFALGCINNSNVEPHLKLRTAESFYRRARTLMPLDALDSPSLEVGQYLLLTTHYLSFTKYSHRCDNTLAVAIRVSQTLGLHVDKESSSKSQLRREMSRRVWHLCITMERFVTIPPLTRPLQPTPSKTAVLSKNRLLSSLFGWRALTQLDGKVPLPSAIDDEYLLEDGDGVQPTARPSLLDSFIATIKIFDVFHRAPAINDGYFARALCLPELAQVLQLNEELDQIDAGLPAHLRSDNPEKPSTRRGRALSLQAVAVKIRILHTRLVLLRPNMLATARRTILAPAFDPPPSRAEATLGIEVSTICVQAALWAIDLLHENLQSCCRIFSSTAVYVTLSAATVIIASTLVPELGVSLEDGAGPHAQAVANAFQVLDEHRWQIEGAPRASGQLGRFLETVNKEKRRQSGVDHDLSAILGPNATDVAFGTEGTFDEIDFSNPLWNFQLGDLI